MIINTNKVSKDYVDSILKDLEKYNDHCAIYARISAEVHYLRRIALERRKLHIAHAPYLISLLHEAKKIIGR